MSSNLPPGVSEGDIPGNRWEDEMFDKFLDSDACPETEDDDEIQKAFEIWLDQYINRDDYD